MGKKTLTAPLRRGCVDRLERESGDTSVPAAPILYDIMASLDSHMHVCAYVILRMCSRNRLWHA